MGKNGKMTYIKIKNFRSSKDPTEGVKQQSTESEKIPDEGLISMICKKFFKSTRKRPYSGKTG